MSNLSHPVSGPLKELTPLEFLDLFDPSVRSAILKSAEQFPDKEGLVCFENLQLDSSQAGNRSCLVVGPSNTYTLEAAAAGQLGDVPSRFQYPVAYMDYRKPEEDWEAYILRQQNEAEKGAFRS